MPNTSQATCNSSSGPNVSGQGHGNSQSRSSGGWQECGSSGIRWPHKSQPQHAKKFQGVCPDLKDAIFDCSDYKQADCYMTAVKHVVKYVSANYKNGGDISSLIKKETKNMVPCPARPAVTALANPTEEENDAINLWHEKCKVLLNHESTLDYNIQ